MFIVETSIVDPDPHGSEIFSWIRIQNYCSGTGSSKKWKSRLIKNFIYNLGLWILDCVNCIELHIEGPRKWRIVGRLTILLFDWIECIFLNLQKCLNNMGWIRIRIRIRNFQKFVAGSGSTTLVETIPVYWTLRGGVGEGYDWFVPTIRILALRTSPPPGPPPPTAGGGGGSVRRATTTATSGSVTPLPEGSSLSLSLSLCGECGHGHKLTWTTGWQSKMWHSIRIIHLYSVYSRWFIF